MGAQAMPFSVFLLDLFSSLFCIENGENSEKSNHRLSATSVVELEFLTKFLNMSKFHNSLILLYQRVLLHLMFLCTSFCLELLDCCNGKYFPLSPVVSKSSLSLCMVTLPGKQVFVSSSPALAQLFQYLQKQTKKRPPFVFFWYWTTFLKKYVQFLNF